MMLAIGLSMMAAGAVGSVLFFTLALLDWLLEDRDGEE